MQPLQVHEIKNGQISYVEKQSLLAQACGMLSSTSTPPPPPHPLPKKDGLFNTPNILSVFFFFIALLLPGVSLRAITRSVCYG